MILDAIPAKKDFTQVIMIRSVHLALKAARIANKIGMASIAFLAKMASK